MELFFVIGFFVCIGAGIGGLVLWSQKQQRARREGFEAKGWRVTTLPNGYRVDGELEGCAWTFESTHKRNNHRGRNTWSVAAEPTDRIVLLGPPVPSAMSAMMGSGLGQMVLKMLLGDEAKDLATVNTVVFGGDFGSRVSVMATEESAARELITPEVKEAMLRLDGKFPSVIRWRDRLEIHVDQRIYDAEALQKIVDLGASLVPQLGYGD